MTAPLSPQALAELKAAVAEFDGASNARSFEILTTAFDHIPALIASAEEAGRLGAEIRHRVRFSEWSPTEAEFVAWREKYQAVAEAARKALLDLDTKIQISFDDLRSALDALDKPPQVP